MTTPATINAPAKTAAPSQPNSITLRPIPETAPLPRTPAPPRAKQPVNPPVAPAPQRRPIFDELGVLEPTREQIRERAYQLYLSRNGSAGSADADWLLAEAQLRAEARKRLGSD